MALRNAFDPSETVNLEIIEDIQVRYTTDEVVYDIPPKGDPSQKPDYVTSAEEAVETAAQNLSDAIDAKSELEEDLENARSESDGAYQTWYADQTDENYAALLNKRMAYSTVNAQYQSAASLVSTRTREQDAALKALEKAEERWAVERESIYYKGGKKIGYVYHRYATGRMTYVGYSGPAATSGRDILTAFYTREISKSADFVDGEIQELTQTACPSSVKAVHAQGDNYSIEIEISEDDVKASFELVEPSTLFADANSRQYFIYQNPPNGGD